jgi:DNA-binding NtrC family response regulator
MTVKTSKSLLLFDGNKNGANGHDGVETLKQNCLEALRTLTAQLMREIEVLKTTHSNFYFEDPKSDVCFEEAVRNFEIELIRSALIRCGGNQTRAARLLGLKITTLNTKIKRYNIVLDNLADGQSS